MLQVTGAGLWLCDSQRTVMNAVTTSRITKTIDRML